MSAMSTANALKKRKRIRQRALRPIPVKLSKSVGADRARSASLLQTRLALTILLSSFTFSLYFPALHNPFSNYDDADYVVENANVHQGLILPTLRWALTSTEHANWHPLTWISHAADWQLFGADATGHHLTSLLLHIANVVLLFFFLDRVTRARLRSLAVAALFAVHPLNVESVVWVAERKNVLCMLFFLLTLFAYSSYARRPTVGRYLLVALGLALGLAAKPMLVTVPFVLLLLDFWPLQRIQGWTQPSLTFPAPQASLWRLALEKLPLLAMSAADSAVTMIAQNKGNALRPIARYALPDRVGNAIISYVDYVWKLVWPERLAVFYPHPAGHLRFWRVALCAVLLITASVWVWRQRSRRPYLLAGWCWFLGTLVPVIGLIQVGDQAMANRYVYLPAIGFFIAVVWGLAEPVERVPIRLRSFGVAAAGVALVLLSVLTMRQILTWRSSYDLWTQVLAVDKNNAAAEDVVGSEILMKAMNQGLPYSDEAMVHFQNALRIDPKDGEALLNIGADLQAHGHLPEALQKYQPALQYATDPIIKYRVLTNMASVFEKLGDLGTSRGYYRDALALGVKEDATAFVGFARTFTDDQIASLNKTLNSHPTAEGYWKLGQLQESGGYNDDAKASYHHALQLDPNSAAARESLNKMEQAKL
jgi:tetratricopeptide (TPR) repeat protein